MVICHSFAEAPAGSGRGWPDRVGLRWAAALTGWAILVTIVLLLPDLYIWMQGRPAVLFLALMHLAIAVITYNLLVHVAPVRMPTSLAG